MSLNERNVLVVSAAAALTAIVLIIAVLIGNNVSSRATERENEQSNVQLVECIKAGKTAVECRTLIYGAR